MLNDEDKKVGFILTSITLVFSTFACLTSYTIFIIIIYHLYYKRIKRDDKITILLCAYIYLLLSIYTTILISMNIRTILGDLHGPTFRSTWCLFSGYMAFVILCGLYFAFINQAFYRLVRIVYSQYRWLQYLWLHMILPVIELILACGLTYPLIRWNGVIYLENDYFCFPSFTNIRDILWALCVVYLLPFCFLVIIYIRVIIFIRQQANNRTLVVRQQQDRDVLVIRRILVIVNLLFVLGVPSMVLIAISIITGEEYPLIARISILPVGISMTGLSVVMIFSILQLNSIARKLWKSNRVVAFGDILPGSIQMGTIVGTK